MSDTNFSAKAIAFIKEACDADEKEDYNEALRLYTLAIDCFLTSLKYEKNEKIKNTIRSKTQEYLTRAEQIKEFLKNSSESNNEKKKSTNNTTVPGASNEEEQKLKSQLESSILTETPKVTWEDVAGLEVAKEALKEAVILPLKFPQMFKNRKPWRSILLYGPPGTGKSYLAKAVATEANSTFFSVSASDLLSKWVGDSEKLVKALFCIAREKKPSVIFIDEIDSLCSSRNENESDASRRVKTEFLVQMSGVGNEMDGILVLAATNYPWVLDIAMRRRFQKKIYLGLPDEGARLKMFLMHSKEYENILSDHDWMELAKLTDGYCSSDISNLIEDAVMEPVRIVQNATHYKKVWKSDQTKPHDRDDLAENPPQLFYRPCSPGDRDAIPMNWEQIPNNLIIEPPVNKYHFFKSLNGMKSSVNPQDIEKQLEWTKVYGQTG